MWVGPPFSQDKKAEDFIATAVEYCQGAVVDESASRGQNGSDGLQDAPDTPTTAPTTAANTPLTEATEAGGGEASGPHAQRRQHVSTHFIVTSEPRGGGAQQPADAAQSTAPAAASAPAAAPAPASPPSTPPRPESRTARRRRHHAAAARSDLHNAAAALEAFRERLVDVLRGSPRTRRADPSQPAKAEAAAEWCVRSAHAPPGASPRGAPASESLTCFPLRRPGFSAPPPPRSSPSTPRASPPPARATRCSTASTSTSPAASSARPWPGAPPSPARRW